MLSFLKFLAEALQPIPGTDKGFESLHDLGDGHKVYVKIAHVGNGHHKVTALYKSPEAKPGEATVKRRGLQNVPQNIRLAAVNRVFGDVKHFVDHHDWNSITLGGSDAKNKALYRHVGDKMARQSGGKFDARPLAGAGVRLAKTVPIAAAALALSGTVAKPSHDEMESYRSRVKDGSGRSSTSHKSSSNSSERSSMHPSSDTLSDPKWGSSGIKGPSGPYKADDTSRLFGASSMGSSAASEGK